MTKEKITYTELARRVGDMVLMNEITTADENLFDNLENGNLYNKPEEDEDANDMDAVEIYQYYAITKSGADYLKSVSKELVFYSELLDTYFWGITHYGTSWDGVETEIEY